jgi:hypothetical protein
METADLLHLSEFLTQEHQWTVTKTDGKFVWGFVNGQLKKCELVLKEWIPAENEGDFLAVFDGERFLLYSIERFEGDITDQ